MAEISGFSSPMDDLVRDYRASLQGRLKKLEQKKSSINSRLSAISDIRGKLKTLNTSVREMKQTGSGSKFLSYMVESSNTALVTATASSSSLLGNHSVHVSQVAKTDKLLSSQMTRNATSVFDAEGAGTKTIQLTINGETKDIHVVIQEGDTNQTILSNLAVAINRTNGGAVASVVSDTPTTSRFILTSKATGSSQAIQLSDSTGSLLENLGLGAAVMANRTATNGTSGGFLNSSVASLNSIFKVDGIEVIRESNTVSDVLDGITLNLKGIHTANDLPVQLNVKPDATKIKGVVEKFIKDYNEALNTVTQKTAVDGKLRVRQVLADDVGLRTLKIDMRSMMSTPISSVLSGNPNILDELGITISSTGSLTLSDATKLDDLLIQDEKKVADLFNSSDGYAARLTTLLNRFVSAGGQLDISKDSNTNSATQVSTRIKQENKRIDNMVEKLRKDYTRIQSAIAQATSQHSTMQRLTSQFY